MSTLKRLLLPAVFLASAAMAQDPESLGCYSDNSGTLVNTYMYQTASYCSQQCTEYAYYYIQDQSCYCTNDAPSSEASDCNTPCPGFGTATCGGSDSYTYWQNSDYPGGGGSSSSSQSSQSSSSSEASSSSAPPSTSSSTSESTSEPPTSTSSSQPPSTTSSESSSTTSSSSSSHTTSESSDSSTSSSATLSPSIVTISGKETIYVTQSTSSPTSTSTSSSSTADAASATPTESGSTNSDTEKSSSNGIGSGAIAGIVVGVIAALAILGLLFFFWRRNNNKNDAYTGSQSPSGFSDPFGMRNAVDDKTSMTSLGMGPNNNIPNANFGLQPPDNSFMAVDQRLNPVMLGERRLSEGSIADERDYSRKILRVTNGA